MRPMGQIRPMGIYILALPISLIGRIGLITPIFNATKTKSFPLSAFRFPFFAIFAKEKANG